MEEVIYPTPDPTIAPNNGDPINKPAAPPTTPPLPIEGTFSLKKLDISLLNKPLCSPSSSVYPNNIFCTFLDLIIKPVAAPKPAPIIGPTRPPVRRDIPTPPIIPPAVIAPLESPIFFIASFIPEDIFFFSSSNFLSSGITALINLLNPEAIVCKPAEIIFLAVPITVPSLYS